MFRDITPDDSEWRQGLVMSFVREGWSRFDAEDAFQTVFLRMLAGETEVHHRYAFFRRAMCRELITAAKRQKGDRIRDDRWAARQGTPIAEDVYHLNEARPVREYLSILPTRQRLDASWLYEGFQPGEIAEEREVSPATVRSNLRHTRRTLEPLVAGEGHEVRRWLRSGERVHEAFLRGETLPVAPRSVISKAWQVAKDRGVDPERAGTGTAILDQDEILRRRGESPVLAWVLNDLVELAKDAGQMMVVADADRVVLWRGGASKVLSAADSLGFVEGAYWDMERAGVNGIELASMTGSTVTVSRWEHYCVSQHQLSCLSAPVLDPRDGRLLCVLNLTGTQVAIHHAIQRHVDTVAFRLRQQLRTA
jgi:DNA-directed RNA polymerase specialized sigma24 family protein